MKTIEFKQDVNGGYKLYHASKLIPDGVYILATEAEAEIQQVKADWFERCKKFRKQDADEHEAEIKLISDSYEANKQGWEAEIAALRERQRVLVTALEKISTLCIDGQKIVVVGVQALKQIAKIARVALAAKEG